MFRLGASGLFIGATPLRLRRGFMAECAALMDLWDVYLWYVYLHGKYAAW